VIRSKDDYDLWLDPGMTNVDSISELLKPIDAGLTRAYPVSSRINQAQNDDEDCAKPMVLEGPPQGSLLAFNSLS
jgi:putative SOS response-associated peptidase YedK